MKTIVVGASLFALFFFNDARRRSERNRRLMGQAFTHRLIATQEGERKRIAHELHDSLGQHLVLIRTLALPPRSPADTAQTNHLGRIADQAAVAIQEVENISYDLRPYQLDRLGLTKTVLSLIRTFELSGPIRVTHSVENIDGFFPKEIEINFYRIVQEALSNILKHAHATEVTVTVARMDSVLRLVVSACRFVVMVSLAVSWNGTEVEKPPPTSSLARRVRPSNSLYRSIRSRIGPRR